MALENTIESIKVALSFPVDGIEIDVHLTKDRIPVLGHDKHLKRISDSKADIANLTLAELRRVKLRNGEAVPTLEGALTVIGSGWVMLDIKADNSAKEVVSIIEKFPRIQFIVSGRYHHQTPEFKRLMPNLKVYLTGFIKPHETFEAARRYKADGLSLNGWSLTPITYRLAKRAGLEMMAYTINWPFVAKFINRFYPDVAICTNYPNRFMHHRKRGLSRDKG